MKPPFIYVAAGGFTVGCCFCGAIFLVGLYAGWW